MVQFQCAIFSQTNLKGNGCSYNETRVKISNTSVSVVWRRLYSIYFWRCQTVQYTILLQAMCFWKNASKGSTWQNISVWPVLSTPSAPIGDIFEYRGFMNHYTCVQQHKPAGVGIQAKMPNLLVERSLHQVVYICLSSSSKYIWDIKRAMQSPSLVPIPRNKLVIVSAIAKTVAHFR